MDIPLPNPPSIPSKLQPPTTPDIFNYGFDASLNRNMPAIQSPTVYNALQDATNTGLVVSGGNVELTGLTVAGFERSASPGDDLQAAINALNTSGGGTLKLAAGTYTVRNTLTGYSSISIEGVSADSTILSFVGSANLSFAGTNAYTTGTLTTITSGVNVTGSGTSWLANVTTNHQLFIGTRWYKIAVVTSDTTLILAEGYGDSVTFPANYRAVIPKKDLGFKNITLTGSTGTGLQLNDCRNITFEEVTIASCNVGLAMTNVSEIVGTNTIVVTSVSDGIQATNVGFFNPSGFASLSSGGNGWTMNNVKTSTAIGCAADGNTGDGFNLTSCGVIDASWEANSNGGKGIQLVSGNSEIILTAASCHNNTSDGIKLTGTNTYCKVIDSHLDTNGGWGINIAASTNSNNFVNNNTFNGNTSGTLQDLGTNTNLVAVTTYKYGTSSRAMTTASGSQTIAHGLGMKPSYLEVWAFYASTGTNASIGQSFGSYDNVTQNIVYNSTLQATGNSATNATGNIIVATDPSGNSQAASVTLDSTNINLTWTKTGTPAGTVVFLWKVW